MLPAIITPNRIRGNAFLNGIPNTKATSVAVHAPVKGSGIATNTTRRKFLSKRNMLSCLFLVIENSQVESFSRIENREERAFVKKSSTGKRSTGTIFAIMAIKKTCQKGNLYTKIPKGIAPRSSAIGEAATSAIINCSMLHYYIIPL